MTMPRIRTPEDQDHRPVPVGRLDAARGVRLAVTSGESASTEPLPAGVYLVSATVPVYLTTGQDPVAGDIAGSLVLAPGAVMPLALTDGDRIASRAFAGAGSVLAVPLVSA